MRSDLPPMQHQGERARPGEEGSLSTAKLDFGKAPVWALFMKYFPRAMIAVSYVSEYGKRKYNPTGDGTGWRDVPDGLNRYGDAKARHMLKEAMGELYDDGDSGLPHAAQDAWNAMARLEKMLIDGVIQVRVGNDIKDGKPIIGTAKPI